MRLIFGWFPGRQALSLSLAVVLAVGNVGRGGAAILLKRLFGGGGQTSAPPNALQINPEEFQGAAYCPELRVLVGGESYATFERDHDGDAKYVRYLGSITDTARECTDVSDTGISIKVGI